MKTSLKLFALGVLLLISGRIFAEEKSQVVKRSFKVNPATVISLDNRFGKIHVNTWDNNEVNVNIEIVAEGRDPERILEKISIRFDENVSGNYLGITTELKEFREKSSSFRINYNIDLPRNNKLKLRNKFGDTYLSDMNGDVELNVQYGNLKAGKLNGDTRLDLEFGSAMNHIDFMKKGVVNVKYSKLTIDGSEALIIDSQFSDVFGSKMPKAELEMKYGKFVVENLGSLTGNQSFSEFRTNHLGGNLDLEVKHNQVVIENIAKQVKRLQIEGQFSKIELGVVPGFAADFSMNFQFADLKPTGEGVVFRKILKEPTSKSYEGYIGKEGSSSSIVVNSKYGDVKLNVEE